MRDIDKNLTDKDYIIIGKMWEMKSDLSEHRVIAAISIGRPLKKSEIVHHLNGDHEDNRPENLRVCKNKSEHCGYHSDIIRKIRNKLMIKQKELAKALEITATDLSYIENKTFYPSLDLAKKMASLLKVPIGKFYSEEELELILRKNNGY